MALLHAAVPILRAAVAEVEVGGVGGGATKVAGFISLPAFDAHVRSWVAALPAALEAQLLEQVSYYPTLPTCLLTTHTAYLPPSTHCLLTAHTARADAEPRCVPTHRRAACLRKPLSRGAL